MTLSLTICWLMLTCLKVCRKRQDQLTYLARVHDSLPDKARPVWQCDSLGLVTGIEGAVQPSLTSTADTECHQASLVSPLSLVGHVAMPSHCSTIHEAASQQLWPPLSAMSQDSKISRPAVRLCVVCSITPRTACKRVKCSTGSAHVVLMTYQLTARNDCCIMTKRKVVRSVWPQRIRLS